MVEAIVKGNGTFYKDGTERLYLHIRKSSDHGLPFKDGSQVPIILIIDGIEYQGAIRSRSDFDYLYVSTSLSDKDGREFKQTSLLQDVGLSIKQRIQVSVSGNRIELPLLPRQS